MAAIQEGPVTVTVTVIILIYKENMGHFNTTNQINLVPSFLPISPAEGVSVVIQPCILEMMIEYASSVPKHP